jgi:hypothetical protein
VAYAAGAVTIALAATLTFPVVGGALVAGVAAGALIGRAYQRYYGDNLTMVGAALAAGSDLFGVTDLYAWATDRDIATGEHLGLTPTERRERGSEGGFVLALSVVGAGAWARRVFGGWRGAAPKNAKGILDQLPGKTGKTGPIKKVPNEQALKDLFDTLGKEGKTVNPGTYPGVVKELPDGTIVRMRPCSKSGGATLDITMPDGKIYKVHIQ